MTEEIEQDEFVLRPYQSEILEIAIKENTIIYLPTGAGKTYIAVMLINRLAHSLVEPGKKMSVVLVNTVPLVEQHCLTIKRHTDFEVGQFSGDQNVDYWTKDQWLTQLGKYQVVVLTAQIFLDVLRHGYFSLENVNLLIFDECHQAVNDAPMRQIMQLFQNVSDRNKPRVLGLTATLLNGNCTPFKVREEVRSLEKTFHGTVATVRKLSQVIGFSTNPQEKILHFELHNFTDVIDKAIKMLSNLKDFISEFKFNSDVKTSPKKMLNQEKESKPLTRVLNSVILHLEMFGIYGGSRATLASLIQIERMKRQSEDSCIERIYCVITTTLSCVLTLLEDAMEGYEKSAQIMLFSTPQVITLIELLRTYKAKAEHFCGIVFVKQRFTAKVLYYVIKALSECDLDFGFIRTEFMVGFNAGSGDRDTREAFLSAKINKKIVNSFRNNEINLLIASSVVEEGIDIPRCTLVVKFDRPMDYRSYIQSKGRARHGDSHYYIMVPRSEMHKYEKSYNNFQEVEKLLQEFLVGKTDEREAPSKHEIKKELYEDHDVPPYFVDGPDSPHVAAVSAISLLNRYCQSLCRDKYAPNAPTWYIDTKTEQYEIQYAITIELPIVCPIRVPIQGPYMVTKTAAKRAAALEVCKILHQKGELTDRLLPRTEDEDELDFEYLFTHWLQEPDTDEFDESTKKFKPKPGTKKFIRQYNVAIPRILKNPISNIYYLHPIVMKCDKTWEKLGDLLINTKLNYGLLTKSSLTPISPFPIFVSAGKLNINILENYSAIEISDDDISALKKFNNFLFLDLLLVLKDFLLYNNDEESGFMIVVPVTNNIDQCLMSDYTEVDVNSSISSDYSALEFRIDLDIARQNTSLVRVDEPSQQSKINLQVTAESHLGKVVCPWYRMSDPYIVIDVCNSKNALTRWPNSSYPSYEAYYKDKYGHVLYNPTQPLLEVKGISKRLNCIQPRSATLHAGSKRSKQVMQEGFEEHLIPEMCVLQQYPGTLWYKAHCLPTIIHRVLGLLQAEELRRKITEEAGIGIVEHAQYKKFSCMPVDLRILNKEEKKIQPVQQRNVTEVDATAIMPSQNQIPSKRLTNKDYTAKMLEKQYHWKDEDEPVDIDRNIESITLFQIQDFEHFVSEKYSYDDMEKNANSPKQSKYPAITLEKQYEEKPIEMINKSQTGLGPEQWMIFQCLSSNSANEIVNLERLETLGDSLLKLTSTLFLFLKYPQCNEGRLTNIKGKMIGNKNLLYCGIKKNLGGYIKVFEFSPKTDWLPPSYCVPKMLRSKIDSKELSPNKLFEFGVPLDEQLKGELSEDTIIEFNTIVTDVNIEEPVTNEPITSMNKFLGCQNVQDKTVSDCVEALIGAYLQSNGLVGGLALIGWFNIIPNNLNPKELFYHTPPSPLINPTITQQEIDFHIPNYAKLEKHLGYKFNNRAFLFQALTHASYSINRLTDCYQRLEFLGDAVLDFLITSHIYEISDNLTPGELTDLRSALVNNVTFAVLVARNGFHKHLKSSNTKLMDAIDMFVQFQEERDFAINEEALILVEEDPMYIAEHVHVPKVLGDLFESLAGAVFLDSGMDLQRTWLVFHRLMWREIETFRWNVPKSPVRMLYEYVSAAPRFEKAKVLDNKVTVVSCSVMVNGKKHEVHGFGENKTQAKRAAAKLALRLLSCD